MMSTKHGVVRFGLKALVDCVKGLWGRSWRYMSGFRCGLRATVGDGQWAFFVECRLGAIEVGDGGRAELPAPLELPAFRPVVLNLRSMIYANGIFLYC
jgi:hypothetical protein